MSEANEAPSTISVATLEAALSELQKMPAHSIARMHPSAPEGIISDLRSRGNLVQLDPNVPLDVIELYPPPDTGVTDPPPEEPLTREPPTEEPVPAQRRETPRTRTPREPAQEEPDVSK